MGRCNCRPWGGVVVAQQTAPHQEDSTYPYTCPITGDSGDHEVYVKVTIGHAVTAGSVTYAIIGGTSTTTTTPSTPSTPTTRSTPTQTTTPTASTTCNGYDSSDAPSLIQGVRDQKTANASLTFCSGSLQGQDLSLDSLPSGVTITGLTLSGGALTMSRGTSTNGLTLDGVVVSSGTSTQYISTCNTGGSGSASVILFGSHNTLKGSTIRGGIASGVFLGGDHNTVESTTFSNVNGVNGRPSDTNPSWDTTSCSGTYVSGTYNTLKFNSYDTCQGSCIHIEPQAESLIWGNYITNALQNSFSGSQYHGDGGAIYTGWTSGYGTVIAYNTIDKVMQLDVSTAYQTALYFDNFTTDFVAHNNAILSDSSAIKTNPDVSGTRPTTVDGTPIYSGNRSVYDNYIPVDDSVGIKCTMSGQTAPDCPNKPSDNNNSGVVVNWVAGTNPSGEGILSPPSL
jgi:hypothetical protein